MAAVGAIRVSTIFTSCKRDSGLFDHRLELQAVFFNLGVQGGTGEAKHFSGFGTVAAAEVDGFADQNGSHRIDTLVKAVGRFIFLGQELPRPSAQCVWRSAFSRGAGAESGTGRIDRDE